jgi:hypothetical protein
VLGGDTGTYARSGILPGPAVGKYTGTSPLVLSSTTEFLQADQACFFDRCKVAAAQPGANVSTVLLLGLVRPDRALMDTADDKSQTKFKQYRLHMIRR